MRIFLPHILFLKGLFCLLPVLEQGPAYVAALKSNSKAENGSVYYLVGYPTGPSTRRSTKPLPSAVRGGSDGIYSRLGRSTNPNDRMNLPVPPTPAEGVQKFPTGPAPRVKRELKPGNKLASRNRAGSRSPSPTARKPNSGPKWLVPRQTTWQRA
uniref:Uncharacterized protein n=1 Tax=Rhipicephalus zambeziensis TaxID=60191 RepID=A0A224YKE5_9ACAR